TLKRTWSSLGIWKRSVLLSSLIVGGDDKDEDAEEITAETVEKLKEPKALSEMLSELARALPEVKRPLIDERDAFMMSAVQAAAAQHAKKVVTVVGAAHVPGMSERFGQLVDRAALASPPRPGLVWTALKWLVPALIIGLFVWGFFRFDTAKLGHMALAWIIPT